jgi:molybdopterin synthase sulfur carrier subunit
MWSWCESRPVADATRTGHPLPRSMGREMKVTVEIPSALRRFTDGAGKIECEGANLPGLLESLATKHPAITQHLRDESGQVRRFINIYVNDEDVRFLGGDAYQFRDGDQVLIVPSIAGG